VISADTLLHIDPRTRAVERHLFVDGPPNAAPKPLFQQIIVDPKEPNRFIMRSWGSGILCFDKRTKRFSNVKLPSDLPWNLTNIVFGALALPSGAVLTGFNNELRWYDPATDQLGAQFVTNNVHVTPHSDEINALITGPDGRIWAGGTHGIYLLFEPERQPVRHFGSSRFSSNVTLSKAQDHAGYWAARYYHDRMLFACDPDGIPYDSIRIPDGARLQLEVWDIASTPDGLVYLRTSRGLWRYFPQKREFAYAPVELPGGRGELHHGFGGILAAADGSIWITTNHGAFRSAGGGAAFLPVGQDSARKDQWITPNGSIIEQLDKDHLIIGNTEGSITVVDLQHHTTTIITKEDPRAPELGDLIDIVVLPGGRIQAITRSNGVVCLCYAKGAFTAVQVHREPRAQETYYEACTDTLGYTWIGTDRGVLRFDPMTGTFTHYAEKEGFFPGAAVNILSDERGGILVQNNRWRRFEPAKLSELPPPNGIYIRSVLAQGGSVYNSSNTGTVQFTHDRNSIAIEYAPIDPLHAKDRFYEVHLDGHDERWVGNGSSRSVSYASLAPGDYVFRVRMVGVDGAVGTTALHFTIVPAYWQTKVFKALLVLASVLIVFLLSRYILRLQYLRRIAALEKEREVSDIRSRIARDIHDDLGSGLTRITMLSREMQGPDSADEDKGKLAAHIANASSELIGQLGEIVWAVDPQNDHAEGFIAYVRNMLGKQFEELSISLRTDLTVETGQERRDLPPDVKRNVLLMLKELTNNALKHAQAKTISVHLHIGATALSLTVSDDGHGFDLSRTRPGGNGLGNLRKRAETIGATLTMDSSPSGTTSTLAVPLPAPTIMRGPSA
jgi:signal transduction histidine kinase